MKLSKDFVRLKLASFALKENIIRKSVKITSSDLFWILVIGGTLRLLYYSILQNTQHGDSDSYINYNYNILQGQVNALRTPVYPYFIKAIRIFGDKNLVQNIVIAQSIISFFTVIAFYKIVHAIFQNRQVIVAATLCYATMLPILNFDKAIITESLSINCMVVFIMLIVNFLKEQTSIKAFIITVYIFFAIMLRPSFIFLLPLIIVFWLLRLIIYKKHQKIHLIGLASSILVILLINVYSSLNQKTNGFYGISTVTNVNQLYIAIRTNAYKNSGDTELLNEINNNFAQPLTTDEECRLLQHIIDKYEPERISAFITNCIKRDPRKFIDRILKSFVSMQTSNMFTNYALPKTGNVSKKIINFQFLFFYTTFNHLFIFLFFDLIFIVKNWVKTKQIPLFGIALWSIIVAQIAVAIIGAQTEYQRLIVPIIPCLIITIFSYIDRIRHAIDSNKLKTKYIYI